MANRFKGEATVKADGKTYTLRCDFNAMCAFEDATDINALEAFAKFEGGKISTREMRAMMWAFMQHHQPDSTLQDAGELLSENVDAMRDVIAAASPTAAEVGDLGNAQKSRKKAV